MQNNENGNDEIIEMAANSSSYTADKRQMPIHSVKEIMEILC